MPAVIDTGGPRVLLHCVQRPDCPIPRSSTIVSLSRPACRSFSNRRQTRPCDCCSTLREQPSAEPETAPAAAAAAALPGNDERNEFFRGERSPPVSATSSNDLAAARDRRGRKRSGAELLLHRRRRIRDADGDGTSSVATEIRGLDDRFQSHEHVPRVNEIASEEIVQARPVDETRHQRRPASILLEDEAQSSGTPARNLSRVTRVHHRERLVRELSAIAMRLFGGCGVEQESPPISSTTIEKQTAAAISSQRSRNTQFASEQAVANYSRDEAEKTIDDYHRVECACKCDALRPLKNCENATRERRGRRRSVQQKGRSYLQLALLLFLVAFGHNSLLKTSLAGLGGKSSIGAGIGALTIGTIVGSVGAMPVDLDAGIRAERSANLSHITGASRKIQMYIKNRHLQILPDGTVNGSNDDTSEYTIFQRTSVSRGQLRIQGVATCLYLCMDSCGLLYGSREYTEDCVFNETLEQHNYNTYSSVRWSTAKKTLYLGLNRRGQPRRVQAKGHNLGRLSAYARVLTQVAPPDRVEALQSRMLGAQHNLRHHHNSHHHRNVQQAACPSLPPQENDGRDKFRCRKRKKRKKRKRGCNEGEKPGPHCETVEEEASHRENAESSGEGPPQSKRSCEGAASEELCRRQALDAPAKKRKSRIEPARKNVGTRENLQEKQPKSSGRKEVKPRKSSVGKKSTSGGGNPEEDAPRRVNAASGKRKRPLSRQKAPFARKRNNNNSNSNNNSGRVTRTTLPTSSTIVAMTLPSSWYPGAATTPSAEISAWRRTKTPISPRNSVTSETWKASDSHSSRNGKALGASAELVTESSAVDGSTESADERSALGLSLVDELSAEASEETRSDESTQEDDPTTSSSSEYSTLMTTMDTTPPERTEDYTRATTTESILGSIEVTGGRDDNEDSRPAEEAPRKFGREFRLAAERLVM